MSNPLKQKQFKLIYDKMSRSERREMIDLLINEAKPKLNHRLLDARNRTDILWAISCHMEKQKNAISSVLAYRIYLLSEFPVEVVNQYVMRGNQCYRHKLLRKNPQKPKTKSVKQRRQSIYGWSGELMPRTFLDKLSTPIKTQNDYDRMMERQLGYGRDEYAKRNRQGIYFNK
jgi:hypothetical protein